MKTRSDFPSQNQIVDEQAKGVDTSKALEVDELVLVSLDPIEDDKDEKGESALDWQASRFLKMILGTLKTDHPSNTLFEKAWKCLCIERRHEEEEKEEEETTIQVPAMKPKKKKRMADQVQASRSRITGVHGKKGQEKMKHG